MYDNVDMCEKKCLRENWQVVHKRDHGSTRQNHADFQSDVIIMERHSLGPQFDDQATQELKSVVHLQRDTATQHPGGTTNWIPRGSFILTYENIHAYMYMRTYKNTS